MFAPTVAASLDRTDRVIVERLGLGVWISHLSAALWAIGDLAVNPAKVCQLCGRFTVAALRHLRRPHSWKRAAATVLFAAGALRIETATSGMLATGAAPPPPLFLILTMATGAMFAWGPRPRVAAVLITGFALLWKPYMMTGHADTMVAYPAVALLVAFAAWSTSPMMRLAVSASTDRNTAAAGIMSWSTTTQPLTLGAVSFVDWAPTRTDRTARAYAAGSSRSPPRLRSIIAFISVRRSPLLWGPYHHPSAALHA